MMAAQKGGQRAVEKADGMVAGSVAPRALTVVAVLAGRMVA